MATEFSTNTFSSEVLESSTPVLVDFWSTGCPPCKRLGPIIEELASENADKAKVGKVNVGDNMDLAIQYGITAVPTILVFKDGEVVETLRGFKEKNELQAVLDNHSTSA